MVDMQVIPSITAMEVGVIVSSFLFGIVTLQTFIYFSSYPNDNKYLKTLAGTLWILELAHMIWVAHFIHTATISYRDRQEAIFIHPPPDVEIVVVLGEFTGFLVKAYFTERVRRFTNKLWLSMFISLLILTNMVGSITISLLWFLHGLDRLLGHWDWVPATVWIMPAVVDTINACVLSWCLLRHRQSVLRRSRRLIDKIMLMTIGTGALTSALGVATATCFLTMPYKYIHFGIYICIARVYANSFFAFLNARNSFRQDAMKTITLQFAAGHRAENTASPPSTVEVSGLLSDPEFTVSPIPGVQTSYA